MRVLGLESRQSEGRGEAWCLAVLMFLLPFEPRRPALSLGGIELTWLELAAAASLTALAWASRARLANLARRPRLPLLLLAGYAAAHLVSALLAPVNRTLAFKFSLRMLVMAGCALLVAAAAPAARRSGLLALCATASLVAGLALAEGVGIRVLDPFLDLFREIPFNVGGARRASGGSEYPNLAAAFLMYGLLAGVGLALALRGSATLAGACGLLGGAGLLFTYSRGALVATAIGLVCQAAALWPRGLAAARVPLAALLALTATSAAFAWQGEVFRLRLASEGTAAWYAASYEPAAEQLVLQPGERRTLRVRVTNTGRKTWAVAEQFHLSYHWYDVERRFVSDGARTLLPRDVRAGESVELDALLLAPPLRGRYLLAWDMVHERTTWFSGQGVVPATLTVRVSDRAAAGTDVPAGPPPPADALVWRPSRAELWRVALALWRERPLTGVGSDNFRWLYGPRAGHPFWDSRVFANNTLLEAAATTGSLGLIALGGSLVATTATALRRVRTSPPRTPAGGEAAVLLGLATGIAAHGAVDYVLAFTGHYLLLGFVVGMASAPEAAA